MRVRLTDKTVLAAQATAGERLELWDTGSPGLCLRVTEKGRKVFGLRYRTVDGRQRRLSLGAYSRAFGLADARAAADRVRVDVRAGSDPAGEAKRQRATATAEPIKTFDELADAFLKASESGIWRPRNKKKRDRTVNDERAILKRHVRSTLGPLRLEEIDRSTIRNLLRVMYEKGIRAQTNRTHAVIRQVFAYALGEERLTVNPAASITPIAEEAPRDRRLTDAEMKALWAALQAPKGLTKPKGKGSEERVKVYVGRRLAICVQLCLLLLQRRSEVAGMRVEELDLQNGIWTIPAVRAKGGRSHVVPLPPKALHLIKEALELANRESNRPRQAVFPAARDPEGSIRPDSVTHTVRDVMAALSFKTASPHDLRRTGATYLVSERLGFPPVVVSRLLSHRSDHGGAAAVTMAHYALHDYAPEKRQALEAWEALVLEIVGEKARPDNVRQFAKTG